MKEVKGAHTMTDTTIKVYERYLALDIHKHYLVVGGVDLHQEVVLTPRRVDYERWEAWMRANLKTTDEIVLEATRTPGSGCASRARETHRLCQGEDR